MSTGKESISVSNKSESLPKKPISDHDLLKIRPYVTF